MLSNAVVDPGVVQRYAEAADEPPRLEKEQANQGRRDGDDDAHREEVGDPGLGAVRGSQLAEGCSQS